MWIYQRVQNRLAFFCQPYLGWWSPMTCFFSDGMKPPVKDGWGMFLRTGKQRLFVDHHIVSEILCGFQLQSTQNLWRWRLPTSNIYIYILIYNLLSGIEMAFWYPNREFIRYVWEHLFIRFRTKIQVHVPHICQHWFRHTWHRVMALNSYKWDYSSCN